MSLLPVLAVVVPLLAGAMVTLLPGAHRARVTGIVATGTAAAVTAMCAVLFAHAGAGRLVYWFAGWHPSHAVAVGIDFAVDQLGAGMATLVALLGTAALVFARGYFDDDVQPRFGVLMLLFIGAMVGFCLTGDLFNLFVWFSLMGGAAYALTGLAVEEPSPIQGALNFAVVNTIGTYVLLIGIALLYAWTGALNLAQIGHVLGHRPAPAVVLVAMTLVMVGMFVKAAIVPFHFWLADAHTVAPPPVCVMFSGVMVELGLFGFARIYWTALHGTVAAHGVALTDLLLVLGVVTAVLGAVMSYTQQHLKRLLAFSSISHMGLFLMGFALLDADGLGGTAVYVLAHAGVKAALFLCVGILVRRLHNADEEALRGRGRGMWGTATMWFLGGLALAELPPFGTWLGKAMIEDAGTGAGYHWMPWVFGVCVALTGGAVLRTGARVFFGWGPPGDGRFASESFGAIEAERDEEAADVDEGARTSWSLWVPPAVLLAIGLGVGLVPGLAGNAEAAASRFIDQGGYIHNVLFGTAPAGAAVPVVPPSGSSVVYGIASAVGAVAVAAAGLWRRRLPLLLRRAGRSLAPAVHGLRRLQSGQVGDYAMWLTVGLAVLGGWVAVAIR
jgi:multicomponent Na+:H+ antiporter subunit D